MEHLVSVTIWTALGDMNRREFRAVTADMSASAKFTLLESLVMMKETHPERLAAWKSFFADAKKLSGERNRLLHSPLFSSDLTQITDEVSTLQIARGTSTRGDFDTAAYTIATMNDVADRIRKARNLLLRLVGIPGQGEEEIPAPDASQANMPP